MSGIGPISGGIWLPRTYHLAMLNAPGLVAYFKLGAKTGPEDFDYSGNDNYGIFVNSPTLGATGLLAHDPSTAVVMNSGGPKYFQINAPFGHLFVGTNPWSILMWCNYTAADWDYLFDVSDGGNTEVYIRHTAANLYVVRKNAAGDDGVAATPLAAGTHFLAATYDGATISVVEDGVLHAGDTIASTRSLPALTSATTLAENVAGGAGAVGSYQQLAFFNRGVTPAECAMWYALGT